MGNYSHKSGAIQRDDHSQLGTDSSTEIPSLGLSPKAIGWECSPPDSLQGFSWKGEILLPGKLKELKKSKMHCLLLTLSTPTGKKISGIDFSGGVFHNAYVSQISVTILENLSNIPKQYFFKKKCVCFQLRNFRMHTSRTDAKLQITRIT